MPINCTVRKNYYSLTNQLFIIGGGKMQSMEGTAQSNPTAMEIYAIAVTRKIFMLVKISSKRNCNACAPTYVHDLIAV